MLVFFMGQAVGSILILIGIADFVLGNFMQINLTYFLGPLSTFSPYVFGGLGLLILNGQSDKSNKNKKK